MASKKTKKKNNKKYIKFILAGILIVLVIVLIVKLTSNSSQTGVEGDGTEGTSQKSSGLFAKCGDGKCSASEDSGECCLDCECPEGYSCDGVNCKKIELKPDVKATFYQNTENYYSVTLLKAKGENLGTITLENNGDDDAKDTKLIISSPSGYFADKTINVGLVSTTEYENVVLDLNFLDPILDITSEQIIPLSVEIESYNSENKKYESSESFELEVYGRNFFSWRNPEMISSWVTPSQPTIKEFANKATGGIYTKGSSTKQLLAARWIFESIRAYGVKYTTDAHVSGDYVQFPIETLKNKGGDCEDHAILFASLLEAVGIESFVVLVPGHAYAGYVNVDGEKVFVETTATNFNYFGDDGTSKEIIPPSQNWHTYPQVILPEEVQLNMPSITKEITEECDCKFTLFSNWWTSEAEITFTNSGNAPGAGCAAMTTYSGGQVIGENLECWTVNPGQTRIETYEIDVSLGDILEGCSCSIY